MNDERLERVKKSKPFRSLAESRKRKDQSVIQKEVNQGKKEQERILSALSLISGHYTNRDSFIKEFDSVLKRKGVFLSASLWKSIVSSLAERDENADVVMDKKGNPEPDSELRDYENVPLKEDVEEYMKQEVLPYVPDAWVDEGKTKIGYEISFNRYFYVYTPPRGLEEIEGELSIIEDEIQALLKAPGS